MQLQNSSVSYVAQAARPGLTAARPVPRQVPSVSNPDSLHLFQLGDRVLDVSGRRLMRGRTEVRIQPKVLELLLFLVRRRGEAVPKDALHKALWPDIAVTDASLTQLVKEARRALGETGRSSRVIETLRGWGYRLHADPVAGDPESASVRPYIGRTSFLDRAALHRAEAGERIPSLAFWIDWADTLGVSLEKVVAEARKRVGKPAGEPPERKRLS